METFYWFDYETFGANPQKDRPSQFAGVRTDLDFNIIGKPLVIYCRPTPDYLPHPKACLITGITPQHALKEGLSEQEFVSLIAQEMGQPGTCNVGYNNIRFDDEVTRYTRYRNFFDPYEHEWKNGNSRWDMIDVVRLAHALRPEGIEWPKNEQGSTTFRLEKLSEANGLLHESAHDALSDVYATIDMAKLLKKAQPELFDFAFKNRSKHQVAQWVNPQAGKPFIHVSSKISAAKGCLALMMPICEHPSNSNGVVCFDLRQNPEILDSLETEDIRRRLYSPSEANSEASVRPALKTIHLNKCPIVGPASLLKSLPNDRLEMFDLDMKTLQEHVTKLRALPHLRSKMSAVFDQPYEPIKDPDWMLYSGGFFNQSDRKLMMEIVHADPSELGDKNLSFTDKRLETMLFRYRARNFPETLRDEEQADWQSFCHDRLMSEEPSSFGFKAFFHQLSLEAQQEGLSPQDQFILEELQCYAESLLPYDMEL